jgi:RNA polymerase sigma-B factor
VEHVTVAHALARRYRHFLVTHEDATQAASEALVRAVDRCDPRYGDFIPFLRAWVKGSIRAFAHSQTARGSGRPAVSGAAIVAARDALTQELLREPTNAEVAARLGVPVKMLDDAHQLRRAGQYESIGFSPLRELSTSSHRAELAGETQLSDLVSGLLTGLTPDQRTLIELRYLFDSDVDKIAERVGLSIPDAEQRLAEALGHLRHQALHVPAA